MEALIVERPEMDVVDVYVRPGPDYAITYEGRYGGPGDREVFEAPSGAEAPSFLRLQREEWDTIVQAATSADECGRQGHSFTAPTIVEGHAVTKAVSICARCGMPKQWAVNC